MMQRIALTGLFLLLNFTIHSTGHAQDAAQKPEGAIVRFGTPAKNDKGELTIDRGIESVIFTADGTKVAAGTRDGLLHIYDIKGEKEIASIKAHDGEIRAIVRKGAKSWLTASYDGLIKEWSLEGTAVKTYPKLPGGAWTMAISNSGKKLAVGINTAEIVDRLILLDAATGRITQKLKGPGGINGLAFAPDDLTLLVTDHNVMQMWNLQNGGKLWQRGQEPKEEKGVVEFSVDSPLHSGCAFSPDKKYAAATVDSQMGAYVLIWDAKTGKGHKRFPTRSGHVHFAFSPDSKWIALGGDEPEVVIYSVGKGEIAHDFTKPGQRVTAIAFSPDGTKLVTGSWDSLVTVWDLSVLKGK